MALQSLVLKNRFYVAIAGYVKNNIATSLSGIYEISHKLNTAILFIKIDFTPAGHHQLDLIQIEFYFI